MGTGETGTPTKAAKLSTAQDQQASYPEWAAAFQAYYNSGGQPPHTYFPAAVASRPQPPPYMWGRQPMMPPYGTPAHPPYGAVYSHTGLYGHPAMTPVQRKQLIGFHPFKYTPCLYIARGIRQLGKKGWWTQYTSVSEDYYNWVLTAALVLSVFCSPADNFQAKGSHAYGQFGLLSATAASEGTATLAVGEAAACKLIDSAKNRSPIQGSKEISGRVGLQGSKGSNAGKGNSGSANGVFSQSSGESGSEGSSEGSEEDNPQNILQKRSFEQMTLDGRDDCCRGPNSSLPAYPPQTGGVFASPRGSVAGVQQIPIGKIDGASKMSSSSSLTTNLGIGVQDYWSGSTRGSQGGHRISASKSSVIVPTTPGAPSAGPLGRDGIPPELCLQDEREVKRQRRKQSNRESARRSRLRKQAECEELGSRVDTLTVENMALRTELTRLSEECKKLTAENTSLLGQLQKAQEDDSEVLLDKGVESKSELASPPCDGPGKILNMSSDSPRIHGTGAHDEDSCDSTRKVSSPLESGTCPEAVTAV